MDRDPLPPPFPVGTVLRYVGTMRSYRDSEGRVPLFGPGMEGTVVEVRSGWRGTEVVLAVDEDGEEIVDQTHNGWSVWECPTGVRRAIDAKSKKNWEVISG